MKVGGVCIVDDDKVFRFTTQKYIEMNNLAEKVIAFGDGEEAITFIESKVGNPEVLPDIILLDLNMPIMDGWDFLDEFKKIKDQIGKKVRVNIVTSSFDERDSKRAEQYPIDNYVVKPLSEEYLKELINSLE